MCIRDRPNVFPDLETAREVLDGPILAELQAAYEAGGLKLFGYADSGFRVMTSSKAVRQMSDFSGIKIRTMENPNHIAYWQALGANPTPADFSELYMSLEQMCIRDSPPIGAVKKAEHRESKLSAKGFLIAIRTASCSSFH